MRKSLSWCSGFVLFVLLWSCEDRKPLSEVQQRPPSSSSEEFARIEASHTLDGGPAAAGKGTRSNLSLDGRFSLIWPANRSAPGIEIYDTQRGQLLQRIIVDEAVAMRTSASRARWTVGNHVLLGWGAGANVASAVLYNMDGSRLLEVASSGIAESPSMRYLASYPSLLADAPVIEIYDLSTGRLVASREADSEETSWAVLEVEWQERQFTARYRDRSGRVETLRIDLDAQP